MLRDVALNALIFEEGVVLAATVACIGEKVAPEEAVFV